MQTRNDYGKDVYNGDIGRVCAVEADRREVRVEVDGREIVYEAGDLDELVLAYAVSIHKSQGSEFPAVVFPVLTQHFVLLQRNLIYTALTRAKRMAVIVGTPKALAIGIRNVKGNDRDTGLRERLAAGRLPPDRGA
jgi:exodeoxyribonuclease V alpha subunit